MVWSYYLSQEELALLWDCKTTSAFKSLIRERGPLWNPQNEEYSNNQVHCFLYDQIVHSLIRQFPQKENHLTHREVVRKWTVLYNNYKTLVQKKRKKEKGVCTAKVWKYEKEMNFLVHTTPGTSRSTLSCIWVPPESSPPISSQRSMHSSCHSQNLLKAVADLFSKSRYSDTTIVCEGQLFPAHKVVLAASSGYFNEIFSLLPDKSSVIVLKDISSDIFNDLLKFIYCGKVQIEQSKLKDFLHAANSLNILGIPPFNLCPNDKEKPSDERKKLGNRLNIPSEGSVTSKKAYTPYDDIAKNIINKRGKCGSKRKIPSGGSILINAPTKKAYTSHDNDNTLAAEPQNEKCQPQLSRNEPKNEFPQMIFDKSEAQENSIAFVANSADCPSSVIKNNKDNGSLANVTEECWIKEEFECEYHSLETLVEISCSSVEPSQSEAHTASFSVVSATVTGGENASLLLQPKKIESLLSRNPAIDEKFVKRRVVLLAKKFVQPESCPTEPATNGESSSTKKKNISESPISPALAHGFEYDIIDVISKNDLLLLSKPHFSPETDSGGNILCPICRLKLPDIHRYELHLGYHSVRKMFTCRPCDFCTFKDEDALAHALTHTTTHRNLPQE